MKPGLIAFALTAALLVLDVVPAGWRGGVAGDGFEARHSGENGAEIEARMRLGS